MIVINVDSDEEEAAVRAAQEAGELDFGACSYLIRRGHRSIGGGGRTNTTHVTGGGLLPGCGGGGSGGTVTIEPHPEDSP